MLSTPYQKIGVAHDGRAKGNRTSHVAVIAAALLRILVFLPDNPNVQARPQLLHLSPVVDIRNSALSKAMDH